MRGGDLRSIGIIVFDPALTVVFQNCRNDALACNGCFHDRIRRGNFAGLSIGIVYNNFRSVFIINGNCIAAGYHLRIFHGIMIAPEGLIFPVAQFDAVDTVTHDLISGFLKHIRIGVLGLCCLYCVISLKSTQLKPYPCTNSGRENGSCKDSNGDPASAFSFSVFCFILLKIPDFCSVLLFFSVFSVHFHSPYVLFGLIFCRPFGRSLIPL